MLNGGVEGALHPNSVSLVCIGQNIKPAMGRDSKPIREILPFIEFLVMGPHILAVLFPVLLVLELST